MNALVALFKVFEVALSLFAQWRKEQLFKRRLKLESNAIAHEKLKQATNARNKIRLSRRRSNNSARGKPVPDKLRDNKYRRD